MVETTALAQRRHVLDGIAGLDAIVGPESHGAFAMRLQPVAGRWSLRIDANAARARARIAGFDVAQPINALRETTDNGGARLLSARLGPDEWLLTEDGAAGAASGRALIAELEGTSGQLVDIGHRQIALELGGATAADVLNTGSALNLGPAAFPIGTATRTLFGKAEIVLMRHADMAGGPCYRVECGRSFGRYLYAHLAQSATLIG